MANKENQPPSLAAPLLSGISPNNKPDLNRQRDHSACRRPETPLKVRKTRENLKQLSLYADIPPPCVHETLIVQTHPQTSSNGGAPSAAGHGEGLSSESKRPSPVTRQSRFEEDTQLSGSTASTTLPTESRMQRQKSVSRRMLSKVKQGISGRSKNSPTIKHMESETSLVRRLSGRRKQSHNVDQRSHSFEVVRPSIESGIDETPDFVSFTSAVGLRSFTDSTVSTAEVLGDSPDALTPRIVEPIIDGDTLPGLGPTSSPTSQPPTSLSLNPTPRPPPKKDLPTLLGPTSPETSLAIPCVDLYVVMDTSSVDVHFKREIWVAVEATVRTMSSKVNFRSALMGADPSTRDVSSSTVTGNLVDLNDPRQPSCLPTEPVCGSITTLRLCFKAVQGCLLREVIGQKSVKDLAIGQQCSLFIKVRVPRIRMRDSSIDPDQESLFTELESIIGTLKTEILHVEARYRHSMLPMDNVVTVRHVCKIKRPKTESRWSILAQSDGLEAPAEVHMMLARYLAAHYSSDKAVELLEQYLSPTLLTQAGVRDVYQSLREALQRERLDSPGDNKPSVIVTDIDFDTVRAQSSVNSEYVPTSASTPSITEEPSLETSFPSTSSTILDTKVQQQFTLLKHAPPLLTTPKTTTALSTAISSSTSSSTAEANRPLESQDSARELWRHIRRTSLSSKQLAEMTSDQMNQLEATNDHLRELRQRALANKRSIGAETLRAWKWEESMQNREGQGEAPWM